MDDVRHVEPSEIDVVDALKFVIGVIRVNLLSDVCEDAVTVALSYIKGFAVSRIHKSVDVRFQPFGYFGVEMGDFVRHTIMMPQYCWSCHHL